MRSVVIFLLILLPVGAISQTNRFSAAALSSRAAALLGDSLAWPVLASVAVYDNRSNTFSIPVTASPALQTFRLYHQKVRVVTEQLPVQVKAGAGLFGPSELKALENALNRYQLNLSAGNVDSCLKLSATVSSLALRLESAIERNRLSAVEARLEEKTGIVGQRKGLLGAWKPVETGTLYEENDGVRTYADSRAALGFRDGSRVIMGEHSMATISRSRLDNLTRAVKTDVTLVNGSLLARLSEQSKQRADFRLSVGNARSELQTNRFWANRDGDKRIQVSNYDGEARLTASNVTVTLRRNQGTVVVEGKPPALPVDLLPSPRLDWNTQDSVIYTNQFTFNWSPVRGATRYQLEMALDQDFTRLVFRREMAGTRFSGTFELEQPVYIRLQAFDNDGLRGTDSPTYRLVKNTDDIPPALFLFGVTGDALIIPGTAYRVTGQTEPFSRLTVNGNPYPVAGDGSFELSGDTGKEQLKFVLEATDRAGNSRRQNLMVIPIDPVVLRTIRWNVPVNGTTIDGQGTALSANGMAYPGMEIRYRAGNLTGSVGTASNGEWAVSLPAGEGPALTFDFIHTGSGDTVLTLTFTIR
ncbi:MAG: FecR domain-containing protein [Bacteroidetes bacterium]|nr:FecR domain-containing protein [Bacteroidota bacterium]